MIYFYHPIMNVLLGAALILSGSKLYWLFIGAVGFMVGFEVSRTSLVGWSPMLVAVVGVAVGLAFLVLAIIFQKFAILSAGILAGGLIGMYAVQYFWPMGGQVAAGLAFLTGALCGGILMGLFFEVMLVFLSSVIGAFLVLESFHVFGFQYYLLFSFLLTTGIIFQSSSV